MGPRLLVIAAWILPITILILGVNAGVTIWIYMEPQMATIPTPEAYGVAFWSGTVALLLSVLVAVGISVQVMTSRSAASAANQPRKPHDQTR